VIVKPGYRQRHLGVSTKFAWGFSEFDGDSIWVPMPAKNGLLPSDGREVKHTGDGIMASFVSAVAALTLSARLHTAWPNRGKMILSVLFMFGSASPPVIVRRQEGTFQELGELMLKDFDQPIRANAVAWADEIEA